MTTKSVHLSLASTNTKVCRVTVRNDSGMNIRVRAATDESQKTRNKKQNGLAHSRFIVCSLRNKKKHCLIRESSFSGACAKEPINNLSQVTWLCTWLPK